MTSFPRSTRRWSLTPRSSRSKPKPKSRPSSDAQYSIIRIPGGVAGIGCFGVARDGDAEARRMRLPEYVVIGDVADDEEGRGDLRAERHRGRKQLVGLEDLV